MTTDDVALAYSIFLGRRAENVAVLEQRVGQPFASIVTAFLTSDEFTDRSRSIANGHVDGLFRSPPTAAMLAWVKRHFAPGRRARGRIRSAQTLLEVLCEVLGMEPAHGILAKCLGERAARQLVAELKRTAEKTTPYAMPVEGSSTADDVRNLYLLLHGRQPESGIAGTPRPHESPFALTIEALASREFALRITSSALDQRFGGDQPLDAGQLQWLQLVFGLKLDHPTSRQQALVAILDLPLVRRHLAQRGIIWSVDQVATALRSDGAVSAANMHPSSAPLITLLDASGLFDEAWYAAHNRDVQKTDLLHHLINFGVSEWRDPGPDFDGRYYVREHPNVLKSGLAPLEHYLRIGRNLGYSAKGAPAYTQWLNQFVLLSPEDRASIERLAGTRPRERVVCIHFTQPEQPAAVGAASLADQVGVDVEVRTATPDTGSDTLMDDIAEGTILVLAGAGAVLRPQACFMFAEALRAGGGHLAYADHDHSDAGGEYVHPVFKPEMSPDFMQRLHYAGPVVAVRLRRDGRAAIVRAMESAARGSVEPAFARLLLDADRHCVVRVPVPLFTLPVASDRRFRRVPDVLEPEPGVACPAETAELADPPSVAILIPTRDRIELLRECIDSIVDRTDYPPGLMQIAVIDNGSEEPETIAYFEELASRPGISITASPGPFNFAKICNDGAAAVDTDIVIFLNNDMTVREPDWLRVLVAHAIRPEIGVVGAQLLYPDDTVQHGGIIVGLQGVGGHRLIGVPRDEAMQRDVTREMTAVTGACLALRRSLFTAANGFDEVLAVAFNDVALCMRVAQMGLRNLYVARPLLYHHESKSRGLDDTRAKLARNVLEAIHTRRRFIALFQDDPSYNPNLSLQVAGALALPPRTISSWRRHNRRRRVLLVAVGHGLGHGVAAVLALQAERFRQRHWDVLVGGPASDRDRDYPGCRRVVFDTAEDAAMIAVAEAVDCVVVHTPPFFSITRYLGADPIIYAYDHGEPSPDFFPDRIDRENVDLEKRLCLPLARRVVAISEAIRDESFEPEIMVLRNGNSHLATWSATWAASRPRLRKKFGFGDRYVILNVCRFTPAERAYKGIDDYMRLAAELPYARPEMAGRCLFVLVGRGDEEDAELVRRAGISVFANISDEEVAELYAASDLYVSLSRWEGYNLGIGQALAMGMEVVASDIPAHREFGVPTANPLALRCSLVGEAMARGAERRPRVEDWRETLDRLVDMVEADLC